MSREHHEQGSENSRSHSVLRVNRGQRPENDRTEGCRQDHLSLRRHLCSETVVSLVVGAVVLRGQLREGFRDAPPPQGHLVLNWHQELLERVRVP